MGHKSDFVYTEATYTYHLLKEKNKTIFNLILIIYIGGTPKWP